MELVEIQCRRARRHVAFDKAVGKDQPQLRLLAGGKRDLPLQDSPGGILHSQRRRNLIVPAKLPRAGAGIT